jgi:hypothetical protein
MPSRETDIAKEITLAPVTMRVVGQEDVPLIYGCVPAGKSNDVFWSNSAIFLMRERGTLKELWKTQERNVLVNTAVFDGRYIWAVIQRHLRSPQLLVVDPSNAESSMFSATDGLPGDDVEQQPSTPVDRLAICALEPGRIFVAGSVGRGWLGFAAYDGKKKSIRIFHEAREAAIFSDPKQGEKTTISFRPSYAVAWPHDGGLTMLAGRYSDNHVVARYPLLVNVKAESVLAAPFQVIGYAEHNPTDRAFMTVLGDKFLFAAYNPKLEMPELLCAAAPGLPPESIYVNPPDGVYVAGGGEIHILGKKWWIFDPKLKRLRVAASPVPWKFNSRWSRQGKVDAAEIRGPYDLQLHGVHHSNHYGMLAIVADSSSKREIIQAVRAQPASIRKP